MQGDAEVNTKEHRPRRGQELLLALLVFWSGAYFFHGYQWNTIARYDPIFSFVEPHTPDHNTFRIDRFLPAPEAGVNTGDWARNPAQGPHYYSNKPPGPMLVGVPAYYLLYQIEKLAGVVPQSQAWTRINTYLLNLLLTVLPLALSAPLLMRLLRGRGSGPKAALALTLVLYFATLVLPYATSLWGHSTAVACLIGGLYFFQRPGKAGPAAAGLLFGLAVLTEYSAAFPVILAGFLMLGCRQWQRLGWYCLGGLAPLVIHAWYHQVCFGSWWTVATLHNNTIFLDGDRVGGLFGHWQWEVIWGLTGSPYRGLFWHMPILLLAIPGAIHCAKRRDFGLLFLGLGSILATFAMNLSFNGWHGGACLGPRYLIITLPFFILLAGALPWSEPTGTGVWKRLVLPGAAILLGVISAANMTVITAISTTGSPEATGPLANPLKLYYGKVAQGQIHPPFVMPLRLDGDWLVAPAKAIPDRDSLHQIRGKRVSQANGILTLDRGENPALNWTAQTTLTPLKATKTTLVIGWCGELRLWVNGKETLQSTHVKWGEIVVGIHLQAGPNALVLWLGRPSPAVPAKIKILARTTTGSPLIPFPPGQNNDFAYSGVNLGQKLCLSGIWSLVPWLLINLMGMALLFSQRRK